MAENDFIFLPFDESILLSFTRTCTQFNIKSRLKQVYVFLMETFLFVFSSLLIISQVLSLISQKKGQQFLNNVALCQFDDFLFSLIITFWWKKQLQSIFAIFAHIFKYSGVFVMTCYYFFFLQLSFKMFFFSSRYIIRLYRTTSFFDESVIIFSRAFI